MYEKSAEQGFPEAQYIIGLMHYEGVGTLKDLKKAVYWYEKSAEQGFPKAQYNIGLMYYRGEGTLTDKRQAAYWIKKADENGYEDAKKFWEAKELWKY